MIKTMILILALALAGMAQTKLSDPSKATETSVQKVTTTTPPSLTPDLSNRLLMAERDTAMAVNKALPYEMEMQRQNEILKVVITEAEKVCGATEFVLDQGTAKCVAKPPEKKADAPAKDGGAK